MDRTINVTVTGEFVRKDSKNAGVQGEANVTGLHIVMSDDWEAFSKRIIWRNALGESPVAVLLYNPPTMPETKMPDSRNTYLFNR